MPEIAYVKIEDLATHPERTVNVPDLAEYWGVGESTVYKLAQKEAFKVVRVGRRVKVIAKSALQFEREAGKPEDERVDGQGRR